MSKCSISRVIQRKRLPMRPPLSFKSRSEWKNWEQGFAECWIRAVLPRPDAHGKGSRRFALKEYCSSSSLRFPFAGQPLLTYGGACLPSALKPHAFCDRALIDELKEEFYFVTETVAEPHIDPSRNAATPFKAHRYLEPQVQW